MKTENYKQRKKEYWERVKHRYVDAKKRKRFKILSKFNFTCQYCGRKAPEVILHVDHIHPKSKGGNNNEENLTVACRDCNLGKFDVLLQE